MHGVEEWSGRVEWKSGVEEWSGRPGSIGHMNDVRWM